MDAEDVHLAVLFRVTGEVIAPYVAYIRPVEPLYMTRYRTVWFTYVPELGRECEHTRDDCRRRILRTAL